MTGVGRASQGGAANSVLHWIGVIITAEAVTDGGTCGDIPTDCETVGK